MKTKFDLNNIRVTVSSTSLTIDITTRAAGDFDRKWRALKKQGVKTKKNLYGGSYLFSAQEYLKAEKLCREHEYVGEWPGNLEILEAQKRALIDDLNWLKSHNKNDRHDEEIGEISVELDRVNTDLDKLNKNDDDDPLEDLKKLGQNWNASGEYNDTEFAGRYFVDVLDLDEFAEKRTLCKEDTSGLFQNSEFDPEKISRICDCQIIYDYVGSNPNRQFGDVEIIFNEISE